jgi:hypothetical protein
MVLGLVLSFLAGMIVSMVVMGLMVAASRGDLERELARAQELLRAGAGAQPPPAAT